MKLYNSKKRPSFGNYIRSYEYNFKNKYNNKDYSDMIIRITDSDITFGLINLSYVVDLK